MKGIQNRKNDHIDIALSKQVEAKRSNLLECVRLIHNSLPECNYDEIDCSTTFFGKKVNSPLIINALTGGTSRAMKFNKMLAKAASNFNIPMILGSQRVAIETYQKMGKENKKDQGQKKREIQKIRDSFEIVRDVAPEIILIGNIGIPQIRDKEFIPYVLEALEEIQADGISVHLNPLQEICQPEGEPRFKNATIAILDLKKHIRLPIIVKETGGGMGKGTIHKLIENGIHYIDVSGLGGTSFPAIESFRYTKTPKTNKDKYNKKEKKKAINNNDHNNYLGKAFWNWGIPTAASIIWGNQLGNKGTKIIGSGGLRTGIQMAKSIAIGADYVSVAKPLLKAADQGFTCLLERIKKYIRELKATMFLTGSKNLKSLKGCPHVITGELKDWIK